WGLFLDKLETAIGEVDALGKESDKLTQDAVLGRVENLHDVMIAAEKAKTAMNLTIEVRGKVIEAYKEIMRMNF
ncbi:MAG: flagellar hook-basal body complex protein FliE, partial [Candidatus Riflebacteria bacterium]|nr:flagellar hook-basal body complex protein FliE [Candidatus Riflebacteria bacterium]